MNAEEGKEREKRKWEIKFTERKTHVLSFRHQISPSDETSIFHPHVLYIVPLYCTPTRHCNKSLLTSIVMQKTGPFPPSLPPFTSERIRFSIEGEKNTPKKKKKKKRKEIFIPDRLSYTHARGYPKSEWRDGETEQSDRVVRIRLFIFHLGW